MGQRFYLDEEKLDEQLDKIDNNLFEMLEFAYLHEDMVNTIEELMSDWSKENLTNYKTILKEWEEMSEDEKEDFDNDINEYLLEFGRWWVELYDKLPDGEKKSLIERYRLTIAVCLNSNTYDYDSLKEIIDES